MSQPPTAADQAQLAAAAQQLANAVTAADANPNNAAKQTALRQAQAAAASVALVVATHMATTPQEKADLAPLTAQWQAAQKEAQIALADPNSTLVAPSKTSSVIDAVKKHGASFLETLKAKHHGIPTYGWVVLSTGAVAGAAVAVTHYLKHKKHR